MLCYGDKVLKIPKTEIPEFLEEFALFRASVKKIEENDFAFKNITKLIINQNKLLNSIDIKAFVDLVGTSILNLNANGLAFNENIGHSTDFS